MQHDSNQFSQEENYGESNSEDEKEDWEKEVSKKLGLIESLENKL